MIKSEICYDSRDGVSKINALRYEPDNKADVRAVVQIVHGMAEYAERYEEFAEFLTKQGVVVTADDHLGHGKTAQKSGKYGYFCEQDAATVLVRDVHRLKKLTQMEYPDVPYIIMGHSMGSFITRNYLCRYGTGVSGAIIMGTGMQAKPVLAVARLMTRLQKVLFGPEHVSRFIDKLAFGSYNSRIQQPKTPYDWLSGDEERVAAYVKDSQCGFVFTVNGFETLFELIYRLHKQENLQNVPKKLPILMVSGTADPVGGYGKGVRSAYDSLKKAGVEDITLKLFEEGRHELLNETNREEIMQYFWNWIEEKILREKPQK